MPHERFDNLIAQIDASHQSRERAVDTGAFNPAKHQRNRAIVFFTRHLQRIEQILNTGGQDFTAGQIRDVTTFAILLLVSIAESSERGRDRFYWSSRIIQKSGKRSDRTFITKLAQQV